MVIWFFFQNLAAFSIVLFFEFLFLDILGESGAVWVRGCLGQGLLGSVDI